MAAFLVFHAIKEYISSVVPKFILKHFKHFEEAFCVIVLACLRDLIAASSSVSAASNLP